MINSQFRAFFSPSERVVALSAEEVHVTFKLQLEDEILVDTILLRRGSHSVPQQRQTGQWKVVSVRFVKEQAKVGKDDPELLPTVAILEFPQQKSTKLVLKRNKM